MRTLKAGAAIVAISVAAAVGLTACGDDDERDYITANTVKPQNPLVPGNTTETGGGRIVDSLFTGLVDYDPTTAETRMANAKSIESTDSQNFVVTLNEGWKFHDGSEVKAKNYVDAWNYTSYLPNGQRTSSFFSSIQGYGDVHPADPDGEAGPQEAAAPTAETMSGLAVTGDYTFTIALTAPSGYFEKSLGYTAFSPLPDVFFEDGRESFEKKPVGNGGFKFSKQTSTYVDVERFDDYEGQDKPKAEKLRWAYYSNQDTAYKDVRDGKLDFFDQISESKLAVYDEELDGRAINEPIATIGYIVFPTYDAKYSDARVRRAISMAINRDEITDKVFLGSKTSATDFMPDSIPGHQDGLCGESCTYSPDAAKALLAEAGGFQGDAMELWYNNDGPHKEWTEAACADVTEVLGVPCTAQPTDDFANLVNRAQSGDFQQMFRLAWQADFPFIQNFLQPVGVTDSSSNYSRYTNPAFDAKMAEADATLDEARSIALYQEAEQILLQDMPLIPTWYYNQQSIYSDKVKNVKFDWRGVLVFSEIEFK